MAVLQDININVHGQPSEKRLQTFLRLSQNENGRMINFRVLGPPLPSNCTATFSGTKPDGNVYSKTGTVTGNFVIIEEDIQMTAVAGVWDAKLDIINGTHNIMTALIRVVVDADVVDPDAIASDSQLQGLVAETKYYAEHARTDAYGSPLTAPTKAQMTDHTRVYVYTGSEPNMVAGNWYHWNGTEWISGGVYNAVAVQTDTTLSVAGKAADGKAAGDAVASLKEDLNAETARAEAEEARIEALFTQPVEDAVSDWLDEHPEATTTVQDGSLTETKFSYSLKLATVKDYVTPEMFGAVGDGVADDTEAVRAALKYSIDNGVKLLLPKSYYVTESLLTSEDYSNVKLDIEGTKPLDGSIYAIDSFGGVKFDNGINLFSGLTISGSIYRVSFMPTYRTQTGSIFYRCALNSFRFESCAVSNVLAFCHNTVIQSVSQIKGCRFLTVYYFAKCDDETHSYGCIDSIISDNYINGGVEMTNNHCFEFDSFNGSTVVNNFIDYYQTIYYPYNPNTFTFQGGVSSGNQYQVFRYLYLQTPHCSAVYFNSNGDCFNWTKPSSLAKLAAYTAHQYTGHDNNQHDIPPAILIAYSTGTVSIVNAIIQSNCGNLVFVRHGPTEYAQASNKITIAQGVNVKANYSSNIAYADSIYNNGANKLNKWDFPFIQSLDSLPAVGLGWSSHFLGELANVNNHIYRLVADYNTDNSAWASKWIDVSDFIF